MNSAPVRIVLAVALALALPACGNKGAPTAPAPTTVPASDSAPSWSPDGARIAYAHTNGTVESADRAGIYVIDAQGGAPVHILTGDYAYPDWSPDGRRLVINAVNGRRGIFAITATGDSLTKLTSAWGYAAKWSPDGTTLAYQTYDGTQVYRMWLMASDGTGARKLNPTGSDSWFEPDWSPDGNRLLHVRSGAGILKPEVFVMDTTGAAAQRLTHDGFEARYPVWSPDGQWIAWGSWHETTAELWIMKADGPRLARSRTDCGRCGLPIHAASPTRPPRRGTATTGCSRSIPGPERSASSLSERAERSKRGDRPWE